MDYLADLTEDNMEEKEVKKGKEEEIKNEDELEKEEEKNIQEILKVLENIVSLNSQIQVITVSCNRTDLHFLNSIQHLFLN